MNNENCKDAIKDENIVQAFTGNDRLQQQKIMRCLKEEYEARFFQQVYFKSRYMNRLQAENIAAETFNEALADALESVRLGGYLLAKGRFENYFYRTFKNGFFKKVTRRLNGKEIFNEDLISASTQTDTALPFAKITEEFSETVTAIFKKLSQQCKDYLLWHYIEELSIAKISAITGNREDSVKAQLWRCRNYFKDFWQKD